MIAFNYYSILIVAIFILSLRTLNAPFDAEHEEDEFKDDETEEDKIKRKRLECRSNLSVVFPGNDLREHVKTAIDYIVRITPRTCHITFAQETDSGDVNAYYSSFEPHLLIDGIPKIRDFCQQYKGIVNENLDSYAEFLEGSYTSNRYVAIKKLVYDYQHGRFPSIITQTVDKQEINIPIAYYETMKRTFGLKTGVGGMVGPEDFCNQRYPMPKK